MSCDTKMEKLELLSRTAVLKHGMDGAGISASDKNDTNEGVVLLDHNNRMRKGFPKIPQTQHLLSVAGANGAVSMTSGTNVDRRGLTSSPSILSMSTTTVLGSNIASPVSTDGEDEGAMGEVRTVTSIPLSKSQNNLHGSKACIIESRSPVTTVEYGQNMAVPPSSPFPASPAPYGFGSHPNNNPSLHQHPPQEQHIDYAHSYYPNSNGNLIRTLSEASFVPPYPGSLMSSNAHTAAAGASTQSIESLAAFRPPQSQTSAPRLHLQRRDPSGTSHDDMARQIRELREQLSEKDIVVSSLQSRVNSLENQIHELRQLPTGKISHIPVDDMIRIMQDYGSEVSNQTLPQQRKQSIKKASIVRQFRRWNPNFFSFFFHHNGEWIPKLGREGELRRRAEKRRLLLIAKQNNAPNTNEK